MSSRPNIYRSLIIVLFAAICTVYSGNTGRVRHILLKFQTPSEARVFTAAQSGCRLLFPEPTSLSVPSAAQIQTQGSLQSAQFECQKWVILHVPVEMDPDSMRMDIEHRFRMQLLQSAQSFHIENASSADSLSDRQWALSTLHAQEIWSTATGKGVVVAFIDTGIDWNHEDLKTQVWINSAEDLNHDGIFEAWPQTEIRHGVSGDLDGVDNDGNGYVDDVIGYNFVDQPVGNLGDATDRDPFPYDELGHGTGVAGVIAAAHDNRVGISGLAYDARLMCLRAFDLSGNAYEDDVASAVLYAAMNGARILSCSFGDVVQSIIVKDAMAYAAARGVLVIASSGNSGGAGVHFPSDFSACMSVGASTSDDRRALFSSFNENLSLLAPGQDITTTSPDNAYVSVNGTSFSAPFAAAAAALVAQIHPEYSASEIRTALESSSDPLDSLRWSPTSGAGRINPLSALHSASRGGMDILSPEQDAIVPRRGVLSVRVSVSLTYFRSWSLMLKNAEGSSVTLLDNMVQQTGDEGLEYRIGLDTLRDSAYVLSLIATLPNGKTLHRSQRFTVMNDTMQATLQCFSVWDAGERKLAYQVRSDRTCRVQAVLEKGSTTVFAADEHVGRDHFGLISPGSIAGGAVLRVLALTEGGDSVRLSTNVVVQNDWVPDTGFVRKSFSTGALYCNPQSYDSVRNQFLATDLQSDTRPLKCFGVEHGVVTELGATSATLFPRALARNAHDSTLLALVYAGGQTSVLRMNADGSFGTPVFQDLNSTSLWAMRLVDMDGDGLLDMVAYRTNRTTKDSAGHTIPASDAVELYRGTGDGFRFTAQSELQTKPAPFHSTATFSGSGCAVGDFDGDGQMELAFNDANGSLQVVQWNGSGLSVEAIVQDSLTADAGTEFVTEVDVDGDGIPEILFGSPASSQINADGEYDPQLWRFHVLEHDGIDRYKEIWSDCFYSSRYGRPYYNGVASGTLDHKSGAEFALSVFPSLYVFSFDAASQSIVPLWYHANAWSNSCLISDLDRNGVNELAFTSYDSDSCQWWEWALPQASPQPPSGFRVRALGTDSLRLLWHKGFGASHTVLAGAIVDEQGQTLMAVDIKSDSSELHLPRIAEARWLLVKGTSRRSDTDTSTVSQSRQQQVALSPDIVADHVSVESQSTAIVHVHFNASLANRMVPASAWHVVLDNSRPISVQSSIVESDSSVLLSIPVGDNLAHRVHLWLDSAIVEQQFPPIRADIEDSVSAVEVNCCTPRLIGLIAIHSSYVDVECSDSLDANALTSAFYRCEPGLNIRTIGFLDDSHRRIRVEFVDDQHSGARGMQYTLFASAEIKTQNGRTLGGGLGSQLSWTFSADADSPVFAFPQPFRLSRDKILHFAGVPHGATVAIKTTDGARIATITERLDDGGVVWRPSEDGGSVLSSGVYLFSIVAADGSESDLHRFIFQR